MYFFRGELSFNAFWLWMTHNVLKHEGSKFVRRVSLTFSSSVFSSSKMYLLFLGTIKIIYAHCKKKKERQKENKRKRKESHIQKNKRKTAKSSKITSLEKTTNSMLANIFLDIFMWITILYKHIIVCILLYNLLFTKYHGSFGRYQRI